jgi:hypothetical protein
MGLQLKSTAISNLKNLLSDAVMLKTFVQEATGQVEIPELIVRKLTQLKLLQGVPFHYLVPHPEMLPEESIKFFYLDPNWVNALLDGAFSIGRYAAKKKKTESLKNGRPSLADAPSLSMVHDEVHSDPLHQFCFRSTLNHRAYMLEERDAYVENGRFLYQSEGAINTVISGFLLRSKMVSQWKNLDVMGHPEIVDGAPKVLLNIHRFEAISNDILICLFEGDFKQLDIHQPSQGIHFGLDKKPSPKEGEPMFEKELRSDDSQNTIGTVDVPLRDDHTQVVNMAELAKTMAEKINPKYFGPNGQYALLSSDFALQMVKGVGMVRFIKPEQ